MKSNQSSIPVDELKSPLWLDGLVLLICGAISYLKPLPFPWKVPFMAAIIVGYILIFYGNLKPIGLAKFNWKSTLISGFVIALAVVIGISNLLSPLVEYLLEEKVDTSAYGPLKGNFPFLADYWWKALLSAAIAEEIFYRGFSFYVLERILGSNAWQKTSIVLLTSLYFGWSHSFQGLSGVLGIVAASVVLGPDSTSARGTFGP